MTKDFTNITNFEELKKLKYGETGSETRRTFEAKANAYYLCEMLKTERNKANITQEELASIAEVKKAFISRVENGKVDVQLSTFLKIIHSLGLEVDIKPAL